jgi:hypothetical protein
MMYLKALKAYFRVVFRPDEDEKDQWRTNVVKRYFYYSLENLMIVDPATGCYTDCPMPMPFSLPGKFYWWVQYAWETKVQDRYLSK